MCLRSQATIPLSTKVFVVVCLVPRPLDFTASDQSVLGHVVWPSVQSHDLTYIDLQLRHGQKPVQELGKPDRLIPDSKYLILQY